MINSWSLAYEVLNGTMDETYPIKKDVDLDFIERTGGFEWTPGSPWPPVEHSDAYYDYNRNDPDRKNPFTDPKDRERAFKVTGEKPYIYESPDGGTTITRRKRGDDYTKKEVIQGDYFGDRYPYVGDTDYPSSFTTFSDNDDQIAHHVGLNNKVQKSDSMAEKEFSIHKNEIKKYKEDQSMKDLSDYVISTYKGHYTSKGSNVQTLDLIESVGDAEGFCRSNAIKYLSRYDKKGQAKRDILKAMHYCLLLYYFSGQTHDDELPTRGYETF